MNPFSHKLSLLLCLSVVPIHAQQFDEIVTKSGEKYSEVSVTKVEPDGIRIFHDEGSTKLLFIDLPDDVKSQFQVDEEAAKAHLQKENEERAKAAQQQAKRSALEKRFSEWTTELERKKKHALYGPTELLQSGASKSEVDSFRKQAQEIIENFEKRLIALRRLIAEADQSGVSSENAQLLINAVYNEKVFIGMPKEFVILSWGPPNDINRTMSGRGSSEQWVYRRDRFDAQYIYIDNGLVTSMQD